MSNSEFDKNGNVSKLICFETFFYYPQLSMGDYRKNILMPHLRHRDALKYDCACGFVAYFF